jgi:hypothetical protein
VEDCHGSLVNGTYELALRVGVNQLGWNRGRIAFRPLFIKGCRAFFIPFFCESANLKNKREVILCTFRMLY